MSTKKRAPSPKGSFLLGSIPEIQQQGLSYYAKAWRQFGDIVRFRIPPLVMHQLTHPEHIKHMMIDNHKNYCKGRAWQGFEPFWGKGLVLSEGKLWEQQRPLIQPHFALKKIQALTPVMAQTIEQMIEKWHGYVKSTKTINIHSEMSKLTMNIISKTMFGVEISEKELHTVEKSFHLVMNFLAFRITKLFPLPLWAPGLGNFRFKKSLKSVHNLIDNVILKGKEQNQSSLLSMLLKSLDEKAIDKKLVRDEVITVFFNGHETTGQVLTWVWYLLAKYPEIECNLHQELDKVLAGRLPTQEDCSNLPYTKAIVMEAMRLYPPVWTIARDAIHDDCIAGYHIPAGSIMLATQYITHRHPDFWDTPERFDPQRFMPEQAKPRHLCAYLPFGMGPRACVGKSFAITEAILVVAMIAQHYQLQLIPCTQVEIEAVSTLRPKDGILMTLHKRR